MPKEDDVSLARLGLSTSIDAGLRSILRNAEPEAAVNRYDIIA